MFAEKEKDFADANEEMEEGAKELQEQREIEALAAASGVDISKIPARKPSITKEDAENSVSLDGLDEGGGDAAKIDEKKKDADADADANAKGEKKDGDAPKGGEDDKKVVEEGGMPAIALDDSSSPSEDDDDSSDDDARQQVLRSWGIPAG